AHTLVSGTTTRENLYVAMSRGRDSNRAYVVIEREDQEHLQPRTEDDAQAAACAVLYGVLRHLGAEPSAREALTAEQDRWTGIAQLGAEYETIAQAAQHERWADLLHRSGLSGEQVDDVLASDAFGALSAELRLAEANHHDLDTLLPRLLGARGFDGAEDAAAIIHARLARATARPSGSGRTRKPPQLIAGLIPRAAGPMTNEMRQALDEREALIEARADAVLDTALTEHAPWAIKLGSPPVGPVDLRAWRRQARVVAAYRDRYQITDPEPLGGTPETTAQKIDAARARAALSRARVADISADPAEAGRAATREHQMPAL
ncbi:MAG: MobF family relaxase, partial [Marmoricola sp.]